MIVYKTAFGPKIYEIEATRANDKSVWYLNSNGNEVRSNRHSSYECYHDSWEVAHAYLIDRAEKLCIGLRRSLEAANGTLGNVKGMKKPSEVAK